MSDAILIAGGLAIATALRFLDLGAAAAYLTGRMALPRLSIVVAMCLLALYYNDLYNAEVFRRRSELFVRLLQALGTACLGLSIIYYLDPGHSLGRGIGVLASLTIFTLLLGWRLFLMSTGLLIRAPERVLLLGTGPAGISLVREIISRPEANLRVVGFLDERGENIGKSLVNPGIIGAADDLEEVVVREKVERVILSLTERRGRTPVRQLLDLKFAGVAVEDAHTVWEKISGRIHLEHLSPSWLILSEGFRKPKLLLAAKRALDFMVALLALLLTAPILILVAIAIWWETGRPILFRQERTGRNGRPFKMLKFRSMYQDAEELGPSWAVEGDQRITRVGRLIRKVRLDEFPQLLNVLSGEMSLVGPRPERPVFCEMLERKIPLYAQRHSVRPGITGWAQVKYQYGASVEQAKTKLEYDLFYLKHMSILLDVAILFETAKVMMHGRGAK